MAAEGIIKEIHRINVKSHFLKLLKAIQQTPHAENYLAENQIRKLNVIKYLPAYLENSPI